MKKEKRKLAWLLEPNGWSTLLALAVFAFSLYLLSIVYKVRDAGTWSNVAYDIFRYSVIGLLGVSGFFAQFKIGQFIARYPKLGFGAVLLILGSGFVYAMISDHGHGPGPIFGVFGLLMLAAAIYLIVSEVLNAAKKRRLDKYGERHEARIVQVRRDPVTVNDRPRYTVFCE